MNLIGCTCCGKRWIDTLKIGAACPWCESSCVDLGALPEAAIAPLKASGIPDLRSK